MKKFRFSLSLLILAGFILAVLAAYLPALKAGYVWDDDGILENPLLRNARGLWTLWTSPSRIPQGHYWPLLYTSYWMEYQLWGAHPFGYHLNNILLHGLNAFLVFMILRRLNLRYAWLAAGLFALHPVEVESVAWISERKNVLSGAFFFLSAWLYLYYKECGRRRYYYYSLALFILCLLSKPSAVGLPLALLLILWWKKGRTMKSGDMVDLLAWTGIGAAFSLLNILAIRRFGFSQNLSFIERCLVASRAILFYAGKIFLPFPLMPVYPKWEIRAGNPAAYVSLFAALLVPLILFRLRERTGRGPLAGFLYFAAMLFPMLGFIDFGYMGYSYVADHFQYLASVGIFALVAALAGKVAERGSRGLRGLVTGFSILILLVLGVLSWRHSGNFRDLETLFRYNMTRNPDAAVNYVNIGSSLYRKGNVEEAIGYYKKALDIDPDFVDAHLNLGLVFLRQGKYEAALERLSRASALSPNHEKIRYILGRALLELGSIDEARLHFSHVIQINPYHAQAHQMLGVILAREGKIGEAIRHFRDALKNDPSLIDAHYNLGMALTQTGEKKEAIRRFREEIRLNPNHEPSHYHLALLLDEAGDTKGAMIQYSEAVRINPANAEAHQSLGILFSLKGNLAQGLAHYRAALELQPHDPELHYNMALNLLSQEQPEESIKEFREAIRLRPDWPIAQSHLARALAILEKRNGKDDKEAVNKEEKPLKER